MADLKISALTGASTPLAGTEVLPIVQSGSTVKVSVANLTAGRAVATAGGSFTDNITQSTAGKGINFTANTPAAGMTSQLLNWYEEGTFTPLINGTTTVGSATYASQLGSYTRIGRQVFFQIALDWSAGTGAGALRIGGLPFTSSATALYPAASIGIIDSVALTAGTYPTAFVRPNSIEISFRQSPTGGGSSTDVSYDAAGFVSLSGFYIV